MSKRLFLRLGPSHVAAATRCIAETFSAQSRTDPFTSLFGYSAVHWADMVGPFVRRAGAAPRPLTIVSVDPQTGEVDGVMLNEDWTTGPPPEYSKLGSVRARHRLALRVQWSVLTGVPSLVLGMEGNKSNLRNSSPAVQRQVSNEASAMPPYALFYLREACIARAGAVD